MYLGIRSSLLLSLLLCWPFKLINIPSIEGVFILVVKLSIHHFESKFCVFASNWYALLTDSASVVLSVAPFEVSVPSCSCSPVMVNSSCNPLASTYLNSKSNSTPSILLNDSGMPAKSVSNLNALFPTGNPSPM